MSVWHLNKVQINDLCLIDLFEIEVFEYLTVIKQMADG